MHCLLKTIVREKKKKKKKRENANVKRRSKHGSKQILSFKKKKRPFLFFKMQNC